MDIPVHPSQRAALTPRVLLGFFFPALGGLLFGYDIGATSSAVTDNQVLLDYEVTDNYVIGIIASASLYGALMASVLLYFYGDRIGRKREMLSAAALYIVGSIGSSLAPLGTTGLAFLISCRVIYGLGIGFAMHSVPVYISETAPNAVRGLLIALKEAVVVTGMLAGYAAGALWDGEHGWRYTYLGGAVFAVPFGAGVTRLPYSPRWLVLMSCRDPQRYTRAMARDALLWFRGDGQRAAVDEELNDITETIAGQELGTWAELRKAKRALVVGNGLLLFQQFTCQPSVLYYAVTIFASAGFGASSSTVASVGVAAVKLLATLASSLQVDNYGRRLLLIVGCIGLTISLFGIGLAFQVGYEEPIEDAEEMEGEPSNRGTLNPLWGRVTVACLLLLVSSYQIGFGPISWLMISEIFPLRVRGMALSIGSIVNFGGNIIVTLTFPSVLAVLGEAHAFWMFAFIGVLSTVFVYYVVPETKGRTLEQIEAMMSPPEEIEKRRLLEVGLVKESDDRGARCSK